MSARGINENLPVTTHSDIYPAIDPQSLWQNQAYEGKVVFITGASRGIGQTTALFYAKAGAGVALCARKPETLEVTKQLILDAVPSAKVGIFPADVKEPEAAMAAVSAAVEQFGRLDVLIANAGAVLGFDTAMVDRDPKMWWNTFEVNLFGVYNFLRASVRHLEKVHGRIIAVSSIGAQLRTPRGSDYQISKHALHRLVEFAAQEHPTVKFFAIHPGGVPTELAHATRLEELGVQFKDSPGLSAATMLQLTSGKYDWLSPRYFNVSWDIEEVERDWKEKILEKDLLINKLAVY